VSLMSRLHKNSDTLPRLLVGFRGDRKGLSELAANRNRTAVLRCTCFALRILVGIVRQVQCTLETAVGAFDTREAAFLLLQLLALSPRTIGRSLSGVIWKSFSSTPGTSKDILYCLLVS